MGHSVVPVHENALRREVLEYGGRRARGEISVLEDHLYESIEGFAGDDGGLGQSRVRFAGVRRGLLSRARRGRDEPAASGNRDGMGEWRSAATSRRRRRRKNARLGDGGIGRSGGEGSGDHSRREHLGCPSDGAERCEEEEQERGEGSGGKVVGKRTSGTDGASLALR